MSDDLAPQRQALARKLAARLQDAEAPLGELKDIQERLRMVDGLLAERRAAAGRRLSRALAPMLAVAIVLTIAATLPVPVVPLSLELQASSAALTMADASAIGPIALRGDTRIEGSTVLASPDSTLVKAFEAERPDAMVLSSEQGMLRALQWPANARLTIQASRTALALRVEGEGAPTQAEFELRGRSTLRFGEAARVEERRYQHGEWLRIATAGTNGGAASPLALTLDRAADATIRLTDLRPVALRFAERREGFGGVGAVASSVEGGTLTLPATGDTVKLVGGDWLEIDGLTVERCEVSVGPLLTLRLNGSAGTLRLRVGEFERSLKPSWLEYAARHHLLKLMWGSAAVLWGALAWMRKQFTDVH